jgi:hypothetical protein
MRARCLAQIRNHVLLIVDRDFGILGVRAMTESGVLAV